MSKSYKFKNDRLARAIAATFARRDTAIPEERPDALSRAFAEDPVKQQQWVAFVGNVAVQPGPLAEVIDEIAGFLMPPAHEARRKSSS